MRNLVAAFLCVSLSGAALAAEGGRETERLEKAAEVISEIMGTPEKGIPRDLLNKAVCVGVIPPKRSWRSEWVAALAEECWFVAREGPAPGPRLQCLP